MSKSNVVLKIDGDVLDFVMAMERLRREVDDEAQLEQIREAIVELGAPVRGELPADEYEPAVLRWYSGHASYRDGDLELGRNLGFARLSWTPAAWNGMYGGRVPWEPKRRPRRA
jgi:hypothetical protein